VSLLPAADPGGTIPLATLIGIVTAAAGSLATTIAFLYRELRAAHAREVNALTLDRNTYRAMAEETSEKLLKLANERRRERGLAALPPPPPVVPESHSPPTPEQEERALQATVRAMITLASAELGLPPREVELPKP
jgi:hypothetical protein